MAPSPGRDLATRALLATACTQERVGALLGISRRSVGRVDVDLHAVLRDEEAAAVARMCLAGSESRGSTAEERAAAASWLEEQALLENVSPPVSAAALDESSSSTPTAPRSPRRQPTVVRLGSNGRSTATAARGRPELHAASSPGAGLDLEQVHALTQQQQRILHRSIVLACALKAETPDRVTLDGALADLLEDIAEAARASLSRLKALDGKTIQ